MVARVDGMWRAIVAILPSGAVPGIHVAGLAHVDGARTGLILTAHDGAETRTDMRVTLEVVA